MENSFRQRVNDVKAQARGCWPLILPELGIPCEVLVNRHQPCPMCGGKDRFRFDDRHGNGEYYCNGCGAGNGITLLEKYHRWDFLTTLGKLEALLGISPPPATEPSPSSPSWRMRTLLQRTWEEATPVQAGDAVARYLANRGLELAEFPKVLRTHPALGYYESDGKRARLVGRHPAMIAKVQSVDRRPVTLHRTYLAEGAKAAVAAAKKFFSAGVKGAAIRLYEPDTELALAEGIETALAVHAQTGLPVWAAGSAGNLELVALPEAVKRVAIFADRDENYRGQAAAYGLAYRLACAKPRKAVTVYLPREPGTDFLDAHNARRLLAA